MSPNEVKRCRETLGTMLTDGSTPTEVADYAVRKLAHALSTLSDLYKVDKQEQQVAPHRLSESALPEKSF